MAKICLAVPKLVGTWVVSLWGLLCLLMCVCVVYIHVYTGYIPRDEITWLYMVMPLNLLKSYQTAFQNHIFILILSATYHSSSISMSNQTLAIIYLCDYSLYNKCEVFSQYSYDLKFSVAQW